MHTWAEEAGRVANEGYAVLDVVPEAAVGVGRSVAVAGVDHAAHAAARTVVGLRVRHVWIRIGLRGRCE